MKKYSQTEPILRKGQPRTLRDRVLRYLKSLGLPVGEYRGVKHYLYKGMFIFVGQRGSVRIGRIKSDTHSLTDQVQRQMVLWEQKNGLDQKK